MSDSLLCTDILWKKHHLTINDQDVKRKGKDWWSPEKELTWGATPPSLCPPFSSSLILVRSTTSRVLENTGSHQALGGQWKGTERPKESRQRVHRTHFIILRSTTSTQHCVTSKKEHTRWRWKQKKHWYCICYFKMTISGYISRWKKRKKEKKSG